MFAAVKGYHTSLPGELVTTVVKVGEPVSPNLTITKILVVAPTQIQAFMRSMDAETVGP